MLNALTTIADELSIDSADSAPFDYSTFSAEQQERARSAAKLIKTKLQELVIAIGLELIAVKEALGHGSFIPWLSAESLFSLRTANNYMAAARAFGPEMATVADLPIGIIYEASRASEAVHAEVIRRARAGKQTDLAELSDMIQRDPGSKHKKANGKKASGRRTGSRAQRKVTPKVVIAEQRDLATGDERESEEQEAAQNLWDRLKADGYTDDEIRELDELWEKSGGRLKSFMDAEHARAA